ncbi:MAG TPA: PASTA domain-containing protein [Trebonia sp.]|nr:PASTA domain-containing protein [Trebonia sp.]
MLNAEEQRLADLLKSAVPEPPRQLSADQITMRRARRSRGPRAVWTRPALAAAAVVIIGVTTALAARHWSAGTAPAPRGTGQPAASASPSPGRTPGSPARSVRVPLVIGMTAASAEQVLERLGLSVKVTETYIAVLNAQPGIVVTQFPVAGTTVPSKTTVSVIVPVP